MEQNETSKTRIKDGLSIIIIGTGLGFIILVVIFSYCNQSYDFDNIKELVTIILPVLGAWVGTVIAHHFGKQNFDTVNQSLQNVVKKITNEDVFLSITTEEAMIPLKDIAFLDFTDEVKERAIKKIIDDDKFTNYNRIAFFDSGFIFRYLIHKSTFTLFLVNKSSSENPTDKIKFNEFLNDSDEIKKLTNAVGFISRKSNLLEAKQKMDAINECMDVFVTENGLPTEPVVGLITNNEIQRRSVLK